jgi:hypothetical protein
MVGHQPRIEERIISAMDVLEDRHGCRVWICLPLLCNKKLKSTGRLKRPANNRRRHPQRGWIDMMNPGLPTSLWIQLEGKLWHATGHKGLAGILMGAQIKVSTGDRYRNSFCRCRGCVSLFDFGEEADDQDDFMTSNWFPWLGREHDGRCAIWLEIDRCQCAARLMTPRVVLETVRTEGFKGRFFCGVEACHKGPIPVTCVVAALFIDRYDPRSFVRCDQSIACMPQELESFC